MPSNSWRWLCSEKDRAKMAAVTRYDAKTPNFKFRPDSEAKQRAATTLVRAIASACLGKTYGQSKPLRTDI